MIITDLYAQNPLQLMGNDATHKAARVGIRPPEALGHFTAAGISGNLTGLGPTDILMAFRWHNVGTRLAIITKVRVSLVITTGFTVAQAVSLSLAQVHSYSTATSGGNLISPSPFGPSNNPNTRDSRKAISQFSVISPVDTQMPTIRLSTTTGLAGGVASDSNSFWTVEGWCPAATAGIVIADEWIADQESGVHPLVLANDEGFYIRNNGFAWGAGGVGILRPTIEWSEVNAY